jgi:hypothetical protein
LIGLDEDTIIYSITIKGHLNKNIQLIFRENISAMNKDASVSLEMNEGIHKLINESDDLIRINNNVQK